jgi:hypothetical protein
MSSISIRTPGRLLAAGLLLACFAPAAVRAQTSPTPTPVPGETTATPTPTPAPAAPKPAAPSAAIIKVSDTVNFRLGLLAQPWADWSQEATSGGYVQNFSIRRARILLGGQVAKNVFFFAETENSRLGRTTPTTTKNLGGGFSLLDAAVEWRIRKEFNLQAGLIRVPNSREALKSASTSLALDFSDYTFTTSAAMGSAAGRDTGLMARGFFLKDHLEYRLAGFQGQRDAASRQSFRYVGRLQYNVFDTEPYPFPSYSANNLGGKKILAFGAAYDTQKDFRALTGDVFVDYPVAPIGSLITTVQYQYIDGGATLTNLPRSNVITIEPGFYFKPYKFAVYGRYEQREFTGSIGKDEKRMLAGVNYYPFGHNFNIKAAYGRFYPERGRNLSQFTIQLQVYYF